MGNRIHSPRDTKTGRCEVNILLLSTGGGGGNILRSLKTLFARDVAIAHKTDAKYAERLRRAITARFLDTNEFSLASVPKEERLLIGAATTRGLGSRHSPEVAERALAESREEIERLIDKYSVIVLIGTGGKGTGAGTMFPLADMVRRRKKLILPVFVRPSFERHEVDKRRYDHALHVAAQFDTAGIRLLEILNDHAYSDRDPQPQAVVWERMNVPIARGLRGLLYVLWDLSQVDPSDLSILLAGHGRMRIGFGEITSAEGHDPTDAEIDEAVHRCLQNPYCVFTKPVGTSLICIQGDWSNMADAKIKSGIAAAALGNARAPYNPLYARAAQTPRPWGVTALFTEHTGVHEPLPLEWTARPAAAIGRSAVDETPIVRPAVSEMAAEPATEADAITPDVAPVDATEPATVTSVLEFAKALNRNDPKALELAAGPAPPTPFDGAEVRKLLGTFWFGPVFARLSASWRERLLETLVENLVIPNHVLRAGRKTVKLADATYGELKEIAARATVGGSSGTDLKLMLAIASLWGPEALERVRFVEIPEPEGPSRIASLFGLRG
jgi:cell division GTPase FtsZ